MPQASL